MAMTMAARFRFLSLGVLDFAVDLGQALFAAHGQDGVAKGHENTEQAKQGQISSVQETQGVGAELEVRRGGKRRQTRATHKHRISAP